MSEGLTNQARALALLGQLELAFERSDVPIPPREPATKRGRRSKATKSKRVPYDRDLFPTGHAAHRFAMLVYIALVSTGHKIPRWPDSEDTRLSGRTPRAPMTLHEMRFAAEHFKERGEPRHAKRVREELTHWRAQAKAGEAPEVLDSPPPSPAEVPSTSASSTPASAPAQTPRAYVGPKLPRWVKEGARLRVKATPYLRKTGLRSAGGAGADERVWANEVGRVRRRDVDGGWDWAVEFERGRRLVLDERTAGYLAGVPDETPAPEPPSPAPTGAALEAAIVADALEVIDRVPYLPPASEVRVYLRRGRKYIRVFWVGKDRSADALGSVLHFVEEATGQVYRARSSKAVGPATGRFIRPGAEQGPAAAAAPEPAPSAELTLRALYSASERLTWQRVFADLGMPRGDQDAGQSGIQVRKVNPRAVSVEWVAWGGEGEDAGRARFDEALERLQGAGYGFHMLSGEVGEAAVAEGRKRGIVIVHRSEAAAAAKPASGGPGKPAVPAPSSEADAATALERARAHGRAVSQLGEVYFDATEPGAGREALEALRTVLEEAVRQLRTRPIVERRAFVDEVKAAYRGSAELARSVEGEGWRRGGEPLLRRGTHARIFTEDLDHAFRALEVPHRYVLESPLSEEATPASPAPEGTAPAEEWARHRVVWFRPVDAGATMRRVELKRGDTAWVSLGKRDGKPRGFWASVNGLSQARRQLKMNDQWVELPLVYTQTEMAGQDVPPVPGGAVSSTDPDFTALLEGLRTQRIRMLRVVDTASTPLEMKVTRVLSMPGTVVVEGKVKRTKAKLTIPTDTDGRGRPSKYARMQRGSRQHRIDPRRITSLSAPSSPKAPPPAAPETDVSPDSELTLPEPDSASDSALSEAPSGRRETAFQRERRERAERKAQGLARLADAQWEAAREETKNIPMGQPILVGHHSERQHRRALDRQHRKESEAIETLRAAEAAESAAKRAGYAISSDDPDAIEALEARLSELEASRALNKAVNAAYRKGGWAAVEQVPGVTPALLASAKSTMKVAHWLKVPMDLKNLGANIRRVKKRIEERRAASEREAAPPIEGDGFTITEDPDDNRIRFVFAERPDKAVTAKMKRAGFRWSRRHGAWQRHLNTQGRYAAERMAKELFGWERPQ